MPQLLTSTSLDLVFGSNDYSITGLLPKNEVINDLQIIISGQDDIGSFTNVITPFVISQPQWVQTPAEEFMERLWAFKRINYLLGKGASTYASDDFGSFLTYLPTLYLP